MAKTNHLEEKVGQLERSLADHRRLERELRAAKEDLGKIIGKEGRNAHALRTIVNAAATKLRKRAVLEILE